MKIKKGNVVLTEAEIEHITTLLEKHIQERKELLPTLSGFKKLLVKVDNEFMKVLLSKLKKVKLV